ncbi:hypothetical protein RSOL_223200 [Rhizoctonia solani AG-3 Rhs1AP]|uniref:Uncharacterized protein n=2 Tax=Rhizoctonia solani AG-3 TaxID=1086053 RepID=X8J627_9AGAM|nr:hypothetical protein RSOL_223200 [Rhizoctonia solani AG-3 Rhs1AP]
MHCVGPVGEYKLHEGEWRPRDVGTIPWLSNGMAVQSRDHGYRVVTVLHTTTPHICRSWVSRSL